MGVQAGTVRSYMCEIKAEALACSFLAENRDSIIPYTFMPFGVGPRNCIGQRLAYLETKIALAYLVHQFELVKTLKTEVPLILSGRSNLIKAANGIYVGFQKRMTE